MSFFPVPWCYYALPFTLSSNNFPGVFCNVDMIGMNYLHFYLCMAVFVSPSCLKDSFNLLTDFFFLQHFEFVILPSPNFQFANEESAINHTAIPNQAFSLAAFTIFSASYSSQLQYGVVYRSFLCFLTEILWNFCMFNFFINANNCNN